MEAEGRQEVGEDTRQLSYMEVLSIGSAENKCPGQVGCMRQVLGAGALGRPRGMGWGGRWEGGSGWGTHVNPWLIHVNVWQKPLQYCKVISVQLTKINGKKKRIMVTAIIVLPSSPPPSSSPSWPPLHRLLTTWLRQLPLAGSSLLFHLHCVLSQEPPRISPRSRACSVSTCLRKPVPANG